MAEMKKNRKRSFGLFAALYGAIFLAVIIVGMRVLWNVMEKYEASRPRNAIEAYVAGLDRDAIGTACADFLNTLDENIQSRDESLDVIMNSITELSYKKKSAECTEDRLVYVIKNGDIDVGRVAMVLEKDADNPYGKWVAEEQELDFSYLRGSKTFTIPDNWDLVCGTHVISRDCIIDDSIRYAELEQYYDNSAIEMPTQVTYMIDCFLGDEIRVVAVRPDGTRLTIPEGGFTDEQALNNCTDEEKQAVRDFVEDFTAAYIQFYSNTKNDRYSNYSALREYLVKDSDLDKRLYGAIDGLYWAHSSGDKIQSIDMGTYIKIDGYYIIDYVVTVDTTGREGVVTQELGFELLIRNTDGVLKTEELYTT